MRKNEIREILHRLDMERKKFLGPKLQVLGLTVGEGQARALRTLLEEGPMTQKQLVCAMRLPCPGILTGWKRPDS